MHFPTNWSDRIEIENGKICRILQAEWCDKKHDGEWYYCDVYKKNEDGESWEQNLYCSMWGGYMVAFPGLPINENRNSWYYCTDIAEEEGWHYRSALSNVGRTSPISENDKALVCSMHPDFQYLLKKYKVCSKAELMEKLCMWKKHPELELVLAAGYEKIGMNGNFWRMNEKNRKQICLFMQKYPHFKDFSLKEIREAIKSGKPEDYGCYIKDVCSWERNTKYCDAVHFEDYVYLQNMHYWDALYSAPETSPFSLALNYWRDYMRMLSRTNHNLHDEYWRHPKNLQQKHDEVMEEIRRAEEAERIARELEAREKERKEAKLFRPAIESIKRKFKDFGLEIDGYSIFVTTDFAEWKHQAEVLGQCIVGAGYYQKMLRGMSTIVFIQKEGIPIATAEISTEGKLGQFYADEHDRDNCLPTDEVRAAFEKWMAITPKTKFKPRQAKKRSNKTQGVAT